MVLKGADMPMDMKRSLKRLYTAKQEPELIEVPKRRFLMVDGAGNPESANAFQEAIGALYSVAYTLKFSLKKANGDTFVVPPLEALWWSGQDDYIDLTDEHREWRWRLMLAIPDDVAKEDIEAARKEAEKKHANPALRKIHVKDFAEGLCVQVMHVGPYSAERPTIERMLTYARAHEHNPKGKHHEIYLGDPRRTKPDKLRTILRQPIG